VYCGPQNLELFSLKTAPTRKITHKKYFLKNKLKNIKGKRKNKSKTNFCFKKKTENYK
jgi:hypothetical protein